MLDENNCSRIVGNVDIVEKNNELKANFKKANRCDVIENLRNKKSIKNNYADIDDAIILNVRNDSNFKKIDDDNKCGCSCTQILSIDDVKNLKRAENVIYAHNEKDKIFDTCDCRIQNRNGRYFNKDQYNIVYDKMGGRPSVIIGINNYFKNCLLDTGARMNVIDSSIIKEIGNPGLEKHGDKIWCANGSPLKTLGRIKLKINIGSREENIVFVVVENVSPSIIGGIDLLRRFDIKLVKVIKNKSEIATALFDYIEICNIEAKFGKKNQR